MAILPRSSSLCFTFELFNLQLELALPGNYNVYVSKDRLQENIIVAVRTESQKAEDHGGSNMRVTPNVLSGKEVVVVLVCVDREENERCVIALILWDTAGEV